ncbi:unnamed protein product [Ectocarpus sp. 8 AP-2014]
MQAKSAKPPGCEASTQVHVQQLPPSKPEEQEYVSMSDRI